ncbi:MAG: hypothetical protein ACU84J_12910 [Gammaproteobacteria bacterium]
MRSKTEGTSKAGWMSADGVILKGPWPAPGMQPDRVSNTGNAEYLANARANMREMGEKSARRIVSKLFRIVRLASTAFEALDREAEKEKAV